MAARILEGDYTSCANDPEKYDTYLVHTDGGGKDFAHFNGEGWHPGQMSGGTPRYWMFIPRLQSWLD